MKVYGLTFLTVLGFFCLPAFAQGDFSQEVCLKPRLAVRAGQETCWAQFTVGPDQTFCLSQTLWQKAQIQRLDIFGCQRWVGKWKAYSPLVNEVEGSPHSPNKKILQRFVATQLPKASDQISFLQKIIWDVERAREKISERLRPSDRLGILRKLVLDERTSASPLGLLRMLGFVHLVTAAGIHLYALARSTEALSFRAAQILGFPIRWALPMAWGGSHFLWISVWLLSGLRLGLLRPWLIVSFRFFARSLGLQWRPFAPLFLSLLIDLSYAAIQGELIGTSRSTGRIHYALAVGGGLLAVQLHEKKKGLPSIQGVFREHLLLSVGSWFFTAVWDLWEMRWMATLTPLVSLITLPWITSVIYPSLIALSGLSVFEETVWLEQSFYWVVTSMTEGVVLLSNFLFRSSSAWVVPPWGLLIGLVLGSVLIQIRNRKVQLLLLFGMVLLRIGVEVGGVEFQTPTQVEQLDVGQGDATLVRFLDPQSNRHEAGLIDAGSFRSLSEEAWLKLFAQRGITELKWIALTHLDEDHAGGVKRLIHLMRVQCVVTSEEEWESPEGKSLQDQLKTARVQIQNWNGDCFNFPVLGPDPAESKRKQRNNHMSSIWIPLPGGWSYLNMGDAEGEAELRASLWAKKRVDENADPSKLVLKISHHGSRYSTADPILRILKPKEAWISSGVGNLYSHPTQETLARLKNTPTLIRRTDQQGVIRLQQN